MSTSFIKKMTLKEIGCDPKIARDSKYAPGAKNEDGSPSSVAGALVPLCVILGRVSAIKYTESKFTGDPQAAFLGSFEATNLQANNGVSYCSGKLYVPGGFDDYLEGAFKSVEESGGSIDFAVRISAKYDAASQNGYRFAIENLKEASATDDLAHIRAMVTNRLQINVGPVAAPAKIAAPSVVDAAHTAAAPEPAKTKRK